MFPEGSKLHNSVEAQIAHKKAFITNFVPKNNKIYLVGHSFGSKMVIELLKDEKVIKSVYYLFKTYNCQSSES